MHVQEAIKKPKNVIFFPSFSMHDVFFTMVCNSWNQSSKNRTTPRNFTARRYVATYLISSLPWQFHNFASKKKLDCY